MTSSVTSWTCGQ